MRTLDELFQDIIDDPANAAWTSADEIPVYTARETAKIMIVGQAPGRLAQTSHKPWNDASGRKLRTWLDVTDEQFYDPNLFALVPMDFYYPGKGAHGDLPPRKDFAPKWHPQILANMPDIALIILVGSYAQKYYLGASTKPNLTQTVQAYESYLPQYFPLVHPSPLNFRWLSQNPWFELHVVPVLQNRVAEILKS